MLNKNIYNPEKLEHKSCRDGYGDALLELGKKDKNVVVVSADLAESTRIHHFAKKYPKRFIEVGVAEQNMLGVAAGLALSGKIAFASSFGVFSPGRNWDQLRVSVCYSKANVKIASSHTGLSVGEDGASHQALEDIAITRCLPNLIVLAPADYNQTKKATLAIAQIKQPVYMRFTRQNSPLIYTANTPFKIGKATVLIKGTDLTIVGCGPLLYEAILAAKELKKAKINAEVIDSASIKPLDEKNILNSLRKTKHLISVEEHQANGGLGSALAELTAKKYPVPMAMIAVQDTFGESGTPEKLWDKYKLSAPHIVRAALKILKRK